jgi:hypothetical protein
MMIYIYNLDLAASRLIYDQYNYMIGSDGIIYHKNNRKVHRLTTVDELETQINKIIALQVAKYVLMKLVDGHSVKRLATEFENDASFVDGAIEFLVDMKWIKYNHIRSLYQMTKIGEIKLNAPKLRMSSYN